MKNKVAKLLVVGALMCPMAFAVGCGPDKQSTEKSEKVENEAAWKAAFDLSDITNGTATAKMQGEFYGAQTSSLLWKVDENKESYLAEANGETITSYINYFDTEDISDDDQQKCALYKYDYNDDNSWKRDKSYDNYKPFALDISFFDNQLDDPNGTGKGIADRYQDFHYDEKRGLYVWSSTYSEFNGAATISVDVTIAIKNGKFSAATLYRKSENAVFVANGNFTFEVVDIGNTTVSIPNNIN